ncbi:hypothetical protein FRACYDRAFT_243512 [Fragilariopsis cylindrus CCMP1102]|uniref:Uncharacterized protein n=1 Tax=Fragilariopsis cylindrus CCMP1102 TaxID=635003 RepID=A0A1E7F4E4_9STRA|nr:hypothetical protein FRACYDRAFT_243512 [Fragilariopsis cylindrus CCMP1102]|eukprot:OEU13009.1 hypothetical protein FRACYDRAFT_243512 [Fragilariopsis cylindrus CCMP1102]
MTYSMCQFPLHRKDEWNTFWALINEALYGPERHYLLILVKAFSSHNNHLRAGTNLALLKPLAHAQHTTINVVRGLIQEASEQLDMCKAYDGTRKITSKRTSRKFLTMEIRRWGLNWQ